jgi:hypothetical protein
MLLAELNLLCLPLQLLRSYVHLPCSPGHALWIPCEVSCYVAWTGRQLSSLCFFSLLPVKICLGFKKMHVLETEYVSVFRWRGEKTPTQLGPLERANLNQSEPFRIYKYQASYSLVCPSDLFFDPKMEAVDFSKTLVNFYRTTYYHIQDGTSHAWYVFTILFSLTIALKTTVLLICRKQR